ncbi:MarR family transcriptional regulator [Clostridiales bacterium PH28_bin88]|nr:MarR family transcriptional regulator [Clostridiales bacterium PH28_bin88]
MVDKRELFQVFTRRFGLLNKSCCKCKPLDISLVQSHILYEIKRQGRPSMQQVAETLGLDITTFSRQVQTLVRKGLVDKVQSPEDRRTNLLSLTYKGKLVEEQIDQRLNAYLEEIFSNLSPREKETVIEAIGLLNRAMLNSENCCLPPF